MILSIIGSIRQWVGVSVQTAHNVSSDVISDIGIDTPPCVNIGPLTKILLGPPRAAKSDLCVV